MYETIAGRTCAYSLLPCVGIREVPEEAGEIDSIVGADAHDDRTGAVNVRQTTAPMICRLI